MKRSCYRSIIVGFVFWALYTGGCSTSEIVPPEPPTPPAYTKSLHPQSLDLGELDAIFLDEMAPKDPQFINTCDQSFQKLKSLAKSKMELELGTRQLVKQDPVNYHWCFYGKLKFLEDEMRKDKFLDERQKLVLDTFGFLVPIAQSFSKEYHDTRYYRWAVFRYKKLSEWIFFRKLDLTPEGTSILVQPTNPFGLWRDSNSDTSVLDKYHLTKLPQPSPSMAPGSSGAVGLTGQAQGDKVQQVNPMIGGQDAPALPPPSLDSGVAPGTGQGPAQGVPAQGTPVKGAPAQQVPQQQSSVGSAQPMPQAAPAAVQSSGQAQAPVQQTSASTQNSVQNVDQSSGQPSGQASQTSEQAPVSGTQAEAPPSDLLPPPIPIPGSE